MNIAFYFSGKGTRVRKILQLADQDVHKSIKLLICDNKLNDDLSLNKPDFRYVSFDYERLSDDKTLRNDILSDTILLHLVKLNIDYLFCWGDHILTGKLLRSYKNKIINFHPSILPLFPGRKSIDKAANNKAFVIGNTAHFIDEGIDTGPIIMQSISHISQFIEVLDYDRILDQQILMFKQLYAWLRDSRILVIDNNVKVLNAGYNDIYFFPKIEIKDYE